MVPQEPVHFRSRLGPTPSDLAARLGITSRGLQDLEAGKSAVRHIHVLALDRVSLDIAAECGDPALATPAVRKAALDVVRLILE